jgi:hypothetical protein
MKKIAIVLAALTVLPVAATAAQVAVDVRVAGGLGWNSENWIEFCPDRGAYVALYATFSDGSVHRVFPVADCGSHWVDGWETRAIPVEVPRGVCLTNVQAVASLEWFDPAESWLVSAPRPVRRTHRVVYAGSWIVHQPTWGFVVGSSRPQVVYSYSKTKVRPSRVKSRSGEIAVASSGTYSSVRRRGSGEPARRSGR